MPAGFPTRIAPDIHVTQPAAAGTFSASTVDYFCPRFRGEVVAVSIVNGSTSIATDATDAWTLKVYKNTQQIAGLTTDSDATETITDSASGSTTVTAAAIAAGINYATLTGLVKDLRFIETDYIKVELTLVASGAAITGAVQVHFIEGYQDG